jgi:hypothetical protein
MTLEANRYILVASNTASFQSTYGTGVNVVGEYLGNLSNGGEGITDKTVCHR